MFRMFSRFAPLQAFDFLCFAPIWFVFPAGPPGVDVCVCGGGGGQILHTSISIAFLVCGKHQEGRAILSLLYTSILSFGLFMYLHYIIFITYIYMIYDRKKNHDLVCRYPVLVSGMLLSLAWSCLRNMNINNEKTIYIYMYIYIYICV